MTASAADRADDAGSMPMTMLITMVGVTLSTVLAAALTTQTTTARHAAGSQRAVEAAQAGLDVAVGQIRTATDGTDSNGNGVLSQLPCGPLVGAVSGGGTASYTVTIAFTSTRGGAPIACQGPTVPSFAELTSAGTDAASGRIRTLQATYAFRTTDRNVAGGLLRIYQTATSKDLCVQGSGSVASVQLCTAGNASQTFAYNTDLTISLASSMTDSLPLGRCLDAGAVPHANNAPVTLQPCGATTQVRQQWSFNDNGNLEGTNDGVNTNGFCINVQFPDTVGSALVLKNGVGCGQSDGNKQNFNPDASFGAGAAGSQSGQLVNFEQFGRCLDVPGEDWTHAYLTASPCKQKPDAGQLTWNQKWVTPALAAGAASAIGTISTQPYNTAFRTCVTSPLTAGSTAYVSLTQCPAGPVTNSMRWTVYGDTGVYATSYTVVDAIGNCMAAADPDNPATVFHTSGNRISRIVVVACAGSAFEKWNADPYVLRPRPLTDLSEQ